jgi:hypothetical protein
VHVQNRINKVYQANAYYLSTTSVNTAIDLYLTEPYPTSSHLNTLRISINTYKDGLSANNNVNHFAAANKVLQAVETEFLLQEVGATSFNSNLAQEHTNGNTFANINAAIVSAIAGQTTATGFATAIANATTGLDSNENSIIISSLITGINDGEAHTNIPAAVTALTIALGTADNTSEGIARVIYDGFYIIDSSEYTEELSTYIANYNYADLAVTASSAIGGNDISSVSSADDDSITGVIGNSSLTSIELLGRATSAAGSLSAAYAATNSAVQTAIGTSPIAPNSAISPSSCTYSEGIYSFGSIIYTTSNDLSSAFNNVIACAKWVNVNNPWYFSHDGSTVNCVSLPDPGSALAMCLDYLGVTP